MPGFDFDIAIVGAGPAGLSAAIVLGRCRRTVLVCDHGQPRNAVAHAVHGFLGLDGIAPAELRSRGRTEAQSYGVRFLDEEVIDGCRWTNQQDGRIGFKLGFPNGSHATARKLLLATGTVDHLPEIPNLHTFYGNGVHHCPYCDGWENRDRRLVALGKGEAAAKLALQLLAWSEKTTVCTQGGELKPATQQKLQQAGIVLRNERILRVEGSDGRLARIVFEEAPSLECDAIFFSADQSQRSGLPTKLGCKCGDDGLIKCEGRQGSGIPGLFLAGDAEGDVQFAIVAAAEGAKAATAIQSELHEEDLDAHHRQ